MATVITSDNVPAVLAQIVERQDEQDARIEALIALQTDQAIRDEERDQQFRVQATALRATAAQLSRNIADARKAANGNGNRNSNASANANATGTRNGNRNAGLVGAGVRAEANLGPLEARADVGGGIGTRQNRSQRHQSQAAEMPSEPEAPQKRRAHKWI